MNKHLHNSLRALCLSLAVLLSLPMLAEEVEIDGINYYLDAEVKQAIVGSKSSGKYSGEIVIPESVEHEGTAYSVTSIGNYAFSDCSGLTSVTIPNSVTSIGSQAFWYCSGLTSVTIPNSVESIGDNAFWGCSGLTSVTIGNSVTWIGSLAFCECSGLTSVHISDIAAWCNIDFENNPSNPLSYAHHLYLNGEEVKDLVIPNSVKSIGDWAFWDCYGLTSVTIPNSVTSIGYNAFEGCPGLTSVHISDIAAWCNIDFTNYGSNPLFYANHLYLNGEEVKDLVIPNSVTSIRSFAFTYCSGLTSVTIGSGVESIGERAFYNCSGLTSVVVEDGNPVYDSRNNCNAIIETATNTLLYGCNTTIIPNSVTSIWERAFYGCSGLTSVTIPNSVTSIGDEAFFCCDGLTSVHISDIAAWCNIDFENSTSNPFSYAHHLYMNGEEVKDLVIPNSVTSIGDWAFDGCSGLTSVTIGNSVTSIGEWAFSGCSGLTSVTIPNSVTSIGEDAFNRCDGLTSVHISDIAAWCNIDFEIYSSNPLYYAHHLYMNGEEVKDLVIPNSVKSIGDCAFGGCSGLTSVTIPNSVTSIGGGAFYKCSGLTSVTIPNSVTTIGAAAFLNCSGLTSVTIGSGVESIGTKAFANCPELLDVYCYAENVPSTQSDAFESSPIASATLHVRDASINSYRTTEPWSGFKTITLIEDLTLADGEEFENNTEECFATLTYTRTLPNMLWNPLYVPFKIPYEDLEENYEVAYINAMHSYDNDDNGEIDEMVMEIVKVKAGTLKPNHPYLIKAKNEEAKVMNIVQENAILYPAEITTLDCSSVYTKFEITGTYQKMTSGELNGSLVISTDGAWKKLSPTSTLKPFRFYLTISSREGSPVEIAEEAMSRVRIRVMGEDDNATGIDEVKTANDELKSEIYDLSGRRVSAPAKGGVYVINGKKVIY